MGKKKIIEKTKEELLKETESIESIAAKKGGAPGVMSHRIEHGRIYINSSYNNTFITVTDQNGNVVAWLSSGSLGFSGPKKATPFAASRVAEAIIQKIQKSGPTKVDIFVKGVGSGRDAAVRSLGARLDIVSIKDVTPVPHNGPRPPKVRRV